ncbi:MAG: ASCH domain-containing protein [Treponemataceae bacterium]|nr:ASCH domain-containing protein [Treponemataceae bacterium]
MEKLTVEEFWKRFLNKSGMDPKTGYTSELSFGEDPETSAYLILQILSGKKTAFSSSYYAFEIDRESLPEVGNYYVVTDWADTPYAIIRTERVTTLPFNSIPWSLAEKEGDAENMEEWKSMKSDFFTDDADFMGYNFSPEMPVVFEEFSLLYKNQN